MKKKQQPIESTPSTVPPPSWAVMALAAIAGAGVMVVELGVARILTPVFGGSIGVWAMVLAVSLLALAAGYMVGGRLADRGNGFTVAAGAALVGAICTAIVPLVRRPLLSLTLSLPLLPGSALVALLLIGPSLFFFGQVSPGLIRGMADSASNKVGTSAGGIYAVSTLGSLVGTLLAAWMFLYLPILAGFIGTALLVAAAALVLRRSGPLAPAGLALAVVASIVMTHAEPVEAVKNGRTFRLIEARHTPYGDVRVVEDSGQYRYLLANGVTQGGMQIETGRSAFHYAEGLASLPFLYTPAPKRGLLLGLGPGIVASNLTRTGLQLDAVEIDAEVVDLARRHFGYSGPAQIEDGRRFLERSTGTWDVIIVDVYSGAVPPWQLFTREAFELYRSHLAPEGVVILNIIGSLKDPAQRPALEALYGTARDVFPVADVYMDPWARPNQAIENIVLAAGMSPRREPRHPGEPADTRSMAEALARSTPVSVTPGRILTDDSAPLAPLVAETERKVRAMLRTYIPSSLLL